MNRGALARGCGYALIVLALLETLRVNLITLGHIWRARTSVPWADQWVAVQDAMRLQQGEPLWPIVWTPYWGHRLVIPRLLFLADARWLAFGSLTWLTMLCQALHIALLIGLAWALLKKSPAFFLIAVVVILNLMLSPFQMENFVWGMQTMFALVFLAATAAFLFQSRGWVAGAMLLALISSFTMPNGILVWPVLIAQAAYLKQGRRIVTALSALGAAVIAAYLWHYVRPPELGMGAFGMLRHPIDSLLLLGLIVGSPFRLSLMMDAILGLGVLGVAAYMAFRARREKWVAACLALFAFLFLSSVSLIAGRLTPQAFQLGTRDPLPGRYFTMICLLWVSIGLLALTTLPRLRPQCWLLGLWCFLFVWLMFSSTQRQIIEADDWADFFLGSDAVGAAFFVHAPDEPFLSILWPAKGEREERAAFLEQRHLAMFHEPRSTWVGKSVADLFPPAQANCRGGIEHTLSLDDNSWRVQGWAWDTTSASPPDDIVIADDAGRIVGLGRAGLRHGYVPGLIVEAGPVPSSHAGFRRSEFLGYARADHDLAAAQMHLWGVFRGSGAACPISSE